MRSSTFSALLAAACSASAVSVCPSLFLSHDSLSIPLYIHTAPQNNSEPLPLLYLHFGHSVSWGGSLVRQAAEKSAAPPKLSTSTGDISANWPLMFTLGG